MFWLAGMLGSAFCTKLWQFFITQVCILRRIYLVEQPHRLPKGLLQGIANALIFPLVVWTAPPES